MQSDASASAQFDQAAINEMTLQEGWNFISLPLQPSETDINHVLKDISSSVRVVWGYNNQTKTWRKWKPSASMLSLTSILFGEGYRVYMNKSEILSVAGMDVSPNVQLFEGWNLIGYGGQDNGTVSDSMQCLANAWSVLWTWDRGIWYVKPRLTIALPVLPIDVMQRGKAYWMKLNPGPNAYWQQ